jgi:MFS transporter, ACS family, glucarate transporter
MGYRHRTLALLFFLSVVTYLDRVCIGVAGPRMQNELGIAPHQWGWVVGAFTLGYALFEIPGGMMADRWGARAAHERSRAQGVVWMASRLGGMFSALLVVPIQQRWGWRTSFYVFAVVGVVWCIVWYVWYRDRPEDKRGVSAGELALIRGSAQPRPAHVPIQWGRLVRKAAFWKLLFTYHAYAWGAFFYVGWLHTYLQKGRGFSEDAMKVWSALPFLLGAMGNFTGGLLSDMLVRRRGLRFGRRLVGTVGLALGACFLFAAAFTENDLAAAVFLCLGSFSMDCFLPVAWAMTLDMGRRSAGSLSGAMNMAGQLGSFVSSVVFGYLVRALAGNYSLSLVPLAAMTALSAVVFTRIDPTVPLVEEEPVTAAGGR